MWCTLSVVFASIVDKLDILKYLKKRYGSLLQWWKARRVLETSMKIRLTQMSLRRREIRSEGFVTVESLDHHEANLISAF